MTKLASKYPNIEVPVNIRRRINCSLSKVHILIRVENEEISVVLLLTILGICLMVLEGVRPVVSLPNLPITFLGL